MGRGPRGSMEDGMETKKMKLSIEQIQNLIKEELRMMLEEEGEDLVEDAFDEVVGSREFDKYMDKLGQHYGSPGGMDRELRELEKDLDLKREEIEKKFNLSRDQIYELDDRISERMEAY